ncbi:MAG TPA: glycosyltransferase family 39 protein [Solirubrobacterales bacterium]|nr:glycosyltransferase family 39 protein [Solirubrobacterales bacterium]
MATTHEEALDTEVDSSPRRVSLPRTDRQRFFLILVIGCLLLASFNAWWMVTYRHGYPLDIDEAGYTTIALNDFIASQNAGVHGWWDAIQVQAPHAPLLPALTSVALHVNPGIMAGFFVLIGFSVLLIFTAYGIGERLAGPRLGALVALAVATSQGLFTYTREYVFALPTAAFLSCAVYALLRSDGLRSWAWSTACGVALGLMLLSRTMSIAFIPGILVAAVLVALVRGKRGDFTYRAVNLCLLLLAGGAVAAAWYWRNLDSVREYLTSYGYGSHSQYYGAEHALISWGRVKDVVERMIVFDLLVPLTLLLFVGLVAGGVLLVKRLSRAPNRREEARNILASDAISVLIVVVLGFGALMTSRNGGNGFTFPLAMLLPALAVLALRGARRAAVASVVAIVAAIAVINVVANTDLSEDVGKVRRVGIPLFGNQPWIDGTPNSLDVMRLQLPGPSTHFSSNEKAWPEVDAQIADLLAEPIGPDRTQPIIGLALRHRFMNLNTINLAAVLQHRVGLPIVPLEAEPTDTVYNYVREIRESPLGELNALITASTEVGDFEPVVTQSKAERAAKQLGFRVFRRFTLPDGRQLRLWLKRA